MKNIITRTESFEIIERHEVTTTARQEPKGKKGKKQNKHPQLTSACDDESSHQSTAPLIDTHPSHTRAVNTEEREHHKSHGAKYQPHSYRQQPQPRKREKQSGSQKSNQPQSKQKGNIGHSTHSGSVKSKDSKITQISSSSRRSNQQFKKSTQPKISSYEQQFERTRQRGNPKSKPKDSVGSLASSISEILKEYSTIDYPNRNQAGHQMKSSKSKYKQDNIGFDAISASTKSNNSRASQIHEGGNRPHSPRKQKENLSSETSSVTTTSSQRTQTQTYGNHPPKPRIEHQQKHSNVSTISLSGSIDSKLRHKQGHYHSRTGSNLLTAIQKSIDSKATQTSSFYSYPRKRKHHKTTESKPPATSPPPPPPQQPESLEPSKNEENSSSDNTSKNDTSSDSASISTVSTGNTSLKPRHSHSFTQQFDGDLFHPPSSLAPKYSSGQGRYVYHPKRYSHEHRKRSSHSTIGSDEGYDSASGVGGKGNHKGIQTDKPGTFVHLGKSFHQSNPPHDRNPWHPKLSDVEQEPSRGQSDLKYADNVRDKSSSMHVEDYRSLGEVREAMPRKRVSSPVMHQIDYNQHEKPIPKRQQEQPWHPKLSDVEQEPSQEHLPQNKYQQQGEELKYKNNVRHKSSSIHVEDYLTSEKDKYQGPFQLKYKDNVEHKSSSTHVEDYQKREKEKYQLQGGPSEWKYNDKVRHKSSSTHVEDLQNSEKDKLQKPWGQSESRYKNNVQHKSSSTHVEDMRNSEKDKYQQPWGQSDSKYKNNVRHKASSTHVEDYQKRESEKYQQQGGPSEWKYNDNVRHKSSSTHVENLRNSEKDKYQQPWVGSELKYKNNARHKSSSIHVEDYQNSNGKYQSDVKRVSAEALPYKFLKKISSPIIHQIDYNELKRLSQERLGSQKGNQEKLSDTHQGQYGYQSPKDPQSQRNSSEPFYSSNQNNKTHPKTFGGQSHQGSYDPGTISSMDQDSLSEHVETSPYAAIKEYPYSGNQSFQKRVSSPRIEQIDYSQPPMLQTPSPDRPSQKKQFSQINNPSKQRPMGPKPNQQATIWETPNEQKPNRQGPNKEPLSQFDNPNQQTLAGPKPNQTTIRQTPNQQKPNPQGIIRQTPNQQTTIPQTPNQQIPSKPTSGQPKQTPSRPTSGQQKQQTPSRPTTGQQKQQIPNRPTSGQQKPQIPSRPTSGKQVAIRSTPSQPQQSNNEPPFQYVIDPSTHATDHGGTYLRPDHDHDDEHHHHHHHQHYGALPHHDGWGHYGWGHQHGWGGHEHRYGGHHGH